MYELDPVTIFFSMLLTWGIGLTPPLLIRYAFIKEPMNKGPAIGVCAFLWFLNIILFTALGSQSKTHGALLLVAFASYWILRKKASTRLSASQSDSMSEALGGDFSTQRLNSDAHVTEQNKELIQPPKTGWWRSKSKGFRLWIFSSVIWSLLVLFYVIAFNTYGSSMSEDEFF